MNEQKKVITRIVRAAPLSSGVYLFKDSSGVVLYVGKARNLRARLQQYIQAYGSQIKETALLDSATGVEWIETENELAALLLEARLVQSYQPRFNVLLKTGQPYLYFLITPGDRPRFELVRTKGEKGTYFGPFIDKTAARRAYRYLIEKFQLFLCGRSIAGGCLAYHLGRCAGSCRPNFDEAGYLERISLLKKALKEKPERVAAFFDDYIARSNEVWEFERSARLVLYKEAVLSVHRTLSLKFDRPGALQRLADRDIWIWIQAGDADVCGMLTLFAERAGVLKKERLFSVVEQGIDNAELLHDYLFEYYRTALCAPQIIVSHAVRDAVLLAQFCAQWHEKPVGSVVIHAPAGPEFTEIVLYAMAYAKAEWEKRNVVPRQLAMLLKLERVPHRIDCFDISHKQGTSMVGACVRFTDGIVDAEGIRNFHITTLHEQNDYAALQEIVLRRYKTTSDLPDLIVIDGGKGQLSAVAAVLAPLLEGTGVGLISLAKREETVFSVQFPEGKMLSQQSFAGQRLIALRDYAHHRAVSFHRLIAKKSISS